MGWKGTVRSLVAYSRAVERESIRRQKFYAKQQKEIAKMHELDAARHEVEEYENYIEVIQTVHRECPDSYDWQSVASTPKPIEPVIDTVQSEKLSNKLINFKPNIFHKLFGREEKAKEKLSNKLKKVKDDEISIYENNMQKWREAVDEWTEMVSVAKGVLNGEPSAYDKAVQEINPFEELSTLGSSISINFISKDLSIVELKAYDDEIVPKQQKSLLKSGKLTIKDLPVGKRNELYQDHICSAVLRIGRELFSLLPLEGIIVNAKCNLLNSSTGRLELQTILSVMLVRDTMNALDFYGLDPSDSMKNFKCNMNFKKALGMSPVDPLQ